MSRLILTAAFLAMASTASAHSGHVDWGAWSFDWEVKDEAGLAIRNVTFQQKLVIYKASLPVIRVWYEGWPDPDMVDECNGPPFADRITWDHLKELDSCGGEKVCIQEWLDPATGQTWLEARVFARIGEYRISQKWYFNQNGWMTARVASRGLECEVDHRHSPTWRFDFDLDGEWNDRVFEYNDYTPNLGWGKGWSKIEHEDFDRRNLSAHRSWYVQEKAKTVGAWIVPGATDVEGHFPLSFADFVAAKYHGEEDQGWTGTPFLGNPWHDPIMLTNNENLWNTDITFWYVGDLYHHESSGEDEWLWGGPWIFVDLN